MSWLETSSMHARKNRIQTVSPKSKYVLFFSSPLLFFVVIMVTVDLYCNINIEKRSTFYFPSCFFQKKKNELLSFVLLFFIHRNHSPFDVMSPFSGRGAPKAHRRETVHRMLRADTGEFVKSVRGLRARVQGEDARQDRQEEEGRQGLHRHVKKRNNKTNNLLRTSLYTPINLSYFHPEYYHKSIYLHICTYTHHMHKHT